MVFTSGRTPDAEVLADEAVALLEPFGRTRELARAYATRTLLRMVVSDLEGTVAWGTSAIELAERLGDTRDARARAQQCRDRDAVLRRTGR